MCDSVLRRATQPVEKIITDGNHLLLYEASSNCHRCVCVCAYTYIYIYIYIYIYKCRVFGFDYFLFCLCVCVCAQNRQLKYSRIRTVTRNSLDLNEVFCPGCTSLFITAWIMLNPDSITAGVAGLIRQYTHNNLCAVFVVLFYLRNGVCKT